MVMVALSCGRSPDGAEDIVQKALMKALSIATRDPRALDKVRDPCRWLSGIARNVARDSRRKRQRRARIQCENAEEMREAVFGAGDSDWDVQFDSSGIILLADSRSTDSMCGWNFVAQVGALRGVLASELVRNSPQRLPGS